MLYFHAGLAVLAAYIIGSTPFGLIVARLVGRIDIREKGSGNIGATNVGRILGRKWGVVVFGLDFSKGLLPTLFLVRGVSRLTKTDALAVAVIMVGIGLGTILGHVFPVFLKFKGGKAVSTSGGVMVALDWRVASAAVAVWVLMVLLTRYISVASMSAAAALPVLFIAFNRQAAFRKGLPVTIFCGLLTILVVARHASNIKRLLAGCEAKVLQKKTEGEDG